MMIGEPPPTSFDLNFQMGRIPVRVHPFFWIAGVVLGSRGAGQDVDMAILLTLIWVAVFFFSILIHEMGHAITMQRFGLQPRVLLYMMGGLAIAESTYGFGFDSKANDGRSQIIIAFAGPAAGFIFAALLILMLQLSGITIHFHFKSLYFWSVDWSSLDATIGDHEGRRRLAMFLKQGFHAALFINIFWGLLNLMPVYPLDGGQIARHVLCLQDPGQGIVKSLWLSVYAGAAVACLGLYVKSLFMAIMFGVLAYSSYNAIQMYTGKGGSGGPFGGRPW